MLSLIEKKAWIVFLVIFLVAFLIGILGNSNIPASTQEAITEDGMQKVGDKYFMNIIVNNLLLAVSLLLGFLTFNIYNIVALMYNGVLFGVFFNKFVGIFGVTKTLLLVAPHGLLEITWFILISAFSVRLTTGFYKLLNSNLEERSFFTLLFSRKTVMLLSLALITVLIEIFITPQIYYFISQT